MGLGDWILATADAKVANEKHGVRVVFGDGKNAYWSEVFEGNPRIAKTLEYGERFAWVPNYVGHRPYIQETTADRYIFRPEYRAVPGELYFPRKKPSDYVLIEPNIKEDLMIGKNKDWGFDNWKALTEKLDCKWIQAGAKGVKVLNKKNYRRTNTFKDALYLLSGAKLFIGTDGALHHAAAAMGIPAIVLWGGMASPVNLGYDIHINLWHGDEPCGTHSSICQHCKDAMAKITVEEVHEACKRYLAA